MNVTTLDQVESLVAQLSRQDQQTLFMRLSERLSQLPVIEEKSSIKLSERERLQLMLKREGLYTELSPELKKRAASCKITLKEARAILDRVDKPLSEIVLEQRKSKDW